MNKAVFTKEEVSVLTKEDLVLLQSDEITNDALTITSQQLKGLKKEELASMSVKILDKIPQEITDDLIIDQLIAYLFEKGVIKNNYKGMSSIDICNILNTAIPIDEDPKHDIRPPWYDVIAGIPYALNVASTEYIDLAIERGQNG